MQFLSLTNDILTNTWIKNYFFTFWKYKFHMLSSRHPQIHHFEHIIPSGSYVIVCCSIHYYKIMGANLPWNITFNTHSVIMNCIFFPLWKVFFVFVFVLFLCISISGMFSVVPMMWLIIISIRHWKLKRLTDIFKFCLVLKVSWRNGDNFMIYFISNN